MPSFSPAAVRVSAILVPVSRISPTIACCSQGGGGGQTGAGSEQRVKRRRRARLMWRRHKPQTRRSMAQQQDSTGAVGGDLESQPALGHAVSDVRQQRQEEVGERALRAGGLAAPAVRPRGRPDLLLVVPRPPVLLPALKGAYLPLHQLLPLIQPVPPLGTLLICQRRQARALPLLKRGPVPLLPRLERLPAQPLLQVLGSLLGGAPPLVRQHAPGAPPLAAPGLGAFPAPAGAARLHARRRHARLCGRPSVGVQVGLTARCSALMFCHLFWHVLQKKGAKQPLSSSVFFHAPS